MRSRLWIAGVCVPLLLLLTLAGGPQQDPAGQPKGEPARETLAPLKVLMFWQDKAYGQIRLAVVQKKSERAAQHAWLLAELANINDRHRDDPKYRELARAVRDDAVALAQAAEQEDFERTRELATRINDNCKACHDAFRPD